MMQATLQEAACDIALNAGYMIASKGIDVEDSRELIANIMEWAREFIALDRNVWPAEDYIEAIDKYAARKLAEAYGREAGV